MTRSLGMGRKCPAPKGSGRSEANFDEGENPNAARRTTSREIGMERY